MNRDTFFTAIADRLSAADLSYVQQAYWLVKEAHRRQVRRLTGERYFEHLRRVAWKAAVEYEYFDVQTITLALLHDVVEDTFVPGGVLINLFGQTMYNMVLTVSKEVPSFHPVTGKLIGRVKLSPADYFKGIEAAPKPVRIIKGCDRADNLLDIESWEEPRRNRFVLETHNDIMPIIRATDLRIAFEIESRIVQYRDIYLTTVS